jgi:hypothetical protein
MKEQLVNLQKFEKPINKEWLECYSRNFLFYKHWKYIYTDYTCDVTCELDEIT